MIETGATIERAAALRARLAAAGAPGSLTVVAVTKGFGPDAVRAAVGAGLVDVGENYAQEVVDKAASLAGLVPAPRFHFIGRLQRNKVRLLAGLVTLWQSVDRAELVTEIARRAPGAEILVQLNLSGEEQKGGCPIDDVAELVGQAIEAGLVVRGLMGVGPAGPPESARPGFRHLVALADDLALPVRSIGMSADLEVAVEEGSTMVRVGRDLFGERPPRR
ncbi:MAG TPA: YggS family pyridoxal phosphate-dependent enzyme [Acidimicrobiales bacterium]